MPEAAEKSLAKLLVIGASGHARVVAEAAQLARYRLSGYLAPEELKAADMLLGRYRGGDEQYAALVSEGYLFCLGLGFVNAAGAARRRQVLDRLDEAKLPVIAHPASTLSPSSVLNAGAFLAAGSIVGTRAMIGAGAIINTGAIVDHDSYVGRNTHIAIGARIAGSVQIGENCLIGAGAVILQGLKIGDNAIIGAGAVVLRDVQSGSTVFGNPARMVAGRS